MPMAKTSFHYASLKNHFKYTLLFRKDYQIDSVDLFLSVALFLLQSGLVSYETVKEESKLRARPRSALCDA